MDARWVNIPTELDSINRHKTKDTVVIHAIVRALGKRQLRTSQG